jgi:uncharacterized Tic20 family protein
MKTSSQTGNKKTLRSRFARLCALGVLVPFALGAQDDLTQLPFDQGLPLIVRTAVSFVSVTEIDEVENSFSAVVDVRLMWTDLRQKFPAESAPNGFLEWRTDAAVERMKNMYVPQVGIANFKEEPSSVIQGLRMYPNGNVEYIQRVTGTFKLALDVTKFPFDKQGLAVELISRRAPLERLFLSYEQDDLNFSKVLDSDLDGWTTGLVTLRRDPLPGWYGQKHARVWASLEVTRQPSATLPVIFIPLVASMLIPLIALWLQKQEDGLFGTEAFELANILIGGLFAVIALNFAITTSYSALASGDNPVNRLFGIAYLVLGIAFAVVLLVFHLDLPRRWFGKHVSIELFRFIKWGLPAAALTMGLAVIFLAAA